MKSWALILSVYITLLALVPCCVFDNCPDDRNTAAATSHSGHEQGDEDACGTCSPFFNCSTCNVSLIATTAASFDFTLGAMPRVTHRQYNPALPEDPSASIWQPPKLS